MQNKIDASLEDEFFYCYFKEDAGREDHCSASPRFWVQNMFKKREEFEEYQRFKSFEMRIENFFSSKVINK